MTTQTSINTSTSRKFFGGSGVPRLGGDDKNFLSYGRGIPLRRPSGSPRHFSVSLMHSKKMFVLARFQRSNSLNPVSEDRNFSWGGGGEVVGILIVVSELPWVLVGIGVALVLVSRIWRGPVVAALGGLHSRYQ